MTNYAKFSSDGEPEASVSTGIELTGEWLVIPPLLTDTPLTQLYLSTANEIKVRPPRPVNSVVLWDREQESWAGDIQGIKLQKSSIISKACSNKIVSGFTSSALGAEHHYPSDATDQLNLSATVQRASLSDVTSTDTFPFLCKDSNDIWDYRMHTQAQMETLGADAYNFILAARVKNAQLQAQIQVSTTIEDLNSIQW